MITVAVIAVACRWPSLIYPAIVVLTAHGFRNRTVSTQDLFRICIVVSVIGIALGVLGAFLSIRMRQ